MLEEKEKRERSFSTVSSSSVCRFFIQKKCLRGDSCPYSHDLDQLSLSDEEPLANVAVSTSVGENCSICLQSVLVEGKRFGLLPLCNHIFCIDCIVTWRNTSHRESARKCPVCRVSSFFVIPSPRFFIGDPKIKRIGEYLEFLASKPCRYYSATAEAELCPYGPACFFHHRVGTASGLTTECKMQLVFTRDGDIFINSK